MSKSATAAVARTPHTVIDVTLDTQSFGMCPAEVELERHKAISDLLSANSFQLVTAGATGGPYRLALSIVEERLVMGVACSVTGGREDVHLPLAPLKSQINDYVIICDNFHKMARAGQFHKLEAVDMGRRAVHDEAAESLSSAVEGKVVLDKMTARRLFSLVYVLHMRGVNQI